MSSYYGVIFPEFWTGQTGRELRKHGKEAQLLGLYLATNRHANMLGLYRLRPEDVRHDTGLSLKAIARAFAALQQEAYATCDAVSAFVWVRQMARIRLGLKVGQTLDPEDKRAVATNRIYQALEANPFLGEFFDTNRLLLRLKKRRDSVGLVVPPAFDHQMSGLPSPFEAPLKPDTEIRIRNRDQKQRRAAASPPPSENVKVITKIAHEALDIEGMEASLSTLTDAVKSLCAIRNIPYDSDSVRKAVDSALVQRKSRAS